MIFRLMKDLVSLERVGGLDRGAAAERALARVLGDGVRPLRLEASVFDAVLTGWRRAQGGRHLAEGIKRSREAVVRRFCEHAGRWPWAWQALDVDEWIEDLGSPPSRLAVSTLRLSGRGAGVYGVSHR
jgi:hypothetical protein